MVHSLRCSSIGVLERFICPLAGQSRLPLRYLPVKLFLSKVIETTDLFETTDPESTLSEITGKLQMMHFPRTLPFCLLKNLNNSVCMISYYMPAMFWTLGILHQIGQVPAQLDYFSIQLGEQARNK